MTAPRAAARFGTAARLGMTVERFALPALAVITVAAFASTEAHFRTLANLRVVLASNSVLVVLALATIIPLIGGQFDLSVAATMGAASIACGGALSHFRSPVWLAVLIGVGSGALVGVFNGALVTIVGVNSLIVTLGVSTILPGVVDWYSKGLTIVSHIPPSLTGSASGDSFGIPRSMFWIVPVIALVWFGLTQTPWGLNLEAIGSNAEASRLVGIDTNRHIFASFVTSGTLAGLAGVLTLARDGAANPQTSMGSLLLPALAAVFLGATAFRPGHYNVPGTVIAVFFVAFSVSGLTLAGAAPWVEQVFNGSALVVAVTLSTLASKGKRPSILRILRASSRVGEDQSSPSIDTTPQPIGGRS